MASDLAEMASDVAGTLVISKPVVYGSAVANGLLIAVLAVHAFTGAASVVCSVVALSSKKGSPTHVRFGRCFVLCMVLTALTGIVASSVRLTVNVGENHMVYPGKASPSTYPARIAFLYAGLCICYFSWEGIWGRAPQRRSIWAVICAALLILIGVGCNLLIMSLLDPSTAPVMITFFLAAIVPNLIRSVKLWQGDPHTAIAAVGVKSTSEPEKAARTVHHAYQMMVLSGFSWWGVAQGFIPGIIRALNPPSTPSPYVGNQPAPFSGSSFLRYTVFWFVFVGPAIPLYIFFRRRRLRMAAERMKNQDMEMAPLPTL